MSADSGASHIAVVGAGRMGTGISLSFAFAGFPVQLVDSEERSASKFAELSESLARDIETELAFMQRLHIVTAEQAQQIAARISVTARPAAQSILARADFVFEAVVEVVEVKQATYTWLNTVVADTTIIGSTTSTMLVDTLAEFVEQPHRFLNTHWLNPALLMPLVEMSPGASSSEEAVSAMKALLETIGKQPVICAASPGFIVPRIQALAMTEAARCVEEGVASAEDVDKAIRIGFGVRYAVLGLLEFIDWGGGDIVYYATQYLADSLDEQRFSVPDIIEKNMQEGRNGLRDGQGFYDYRECDVDAYREQRMGDFVKLLQHLSLLPEPG
jgi:3-hydroxybutyryl-CoA dehydrogenase